MSRLSCDSVMVLSVWIAVTLVSAVAAGRDHERCPKNLLYTTKMEVFQESCYQFVSVEKYWNAALTYCRESSGRLVKIDSEAKNEFIKGILSGLYWTNDGIWIGLHDMDSELVWTWMGYEQEENETLVWSNWSPSHPGGLLHTRKDCVRMVRESGLWRWHETFCNTIGYKYRFICEYRALPDGSTSGMSSDITSAIELPKEFSDNKTLTEKEHLPEPRQAEVKSAQEESDSATWMIIIGSSLFVILLVLIVTLIVVCRYKRSKKLSKFATVNNILYSTVPTTELLIIPSSRDRPSCPLPPSCARLEDRIAQRDARATSNIYLNPAATSAYLDMSQSSSSIDKLGEASSFSSDPSYPVYSVPHFTEPDQYYNRQGQACAKSGQLDEPSSEYIPMNRSDEYLYPKDSRHSDQASTEPGCGRYSLERATERYDEPKSNNEYSEIAEAVYNNLYESVNEHA